MDIVESIRACNRHREPERLGLKYAAMRGNAFAFLRGSCHLFYERLPRSADARSPHTWICGDLHFENFGSYKADNRLVYFDINDFDEAVLAPAGWELVRMLASLRVGADVLGIGADDADHLCRAFLERYAASLAAAKAYWVERETSQGLVRQLLDDLRSRDRPAFLDRRTKPGKKARVLNVDGQKALPVSDAQRAMVVAVVDAFARTQPDPKFYKVLDVARRIAGMGSLGIGRYVVLVRGKGSPDGNDLLDLKQALPSALEPRLKVAQPAWRDDSERVIGAQIRMQAVPAAFLHAVSVGGQPYVLRGLQPSQDRVALAMAGHSVKQLALTTGTMADIVAWAQLRSAGRDGSATADELVDFAGRSKWKAKLLDASEACASQVRHDALAFDRAYDDGAFGARPEPAKRNRV